MAEQAPRELELEIGGPAAGGACVARHDGRVVFVRHALPGERVRAVVTEDTGGSFCRADAVEVLRASPDRVTPPCPHAGPGRCGGCDWQHASANAQRRLKAEVVRDQFSRLAGLDLTALGLDPVEAEPLPGGLLGWRTRITWAVTPDGTVGLHRHHSHEVEPVAHCPLGLPAVADAPGELPEGVDGCEVVGTPAGGEVSVLGRFPARGRRAPHARGRRPAHRVELLRGPQRLPRAVGEDLAEIDAAGFWQVHPHALAAFTDALLDGLRPRAGEHVLDLYAGAGALTAALADAVGPHGRALGLESSRTAVADAADLLAGRAHAAVRHGVVDPAGLAAAGDELGTVDLVVLDPPRAGVGAPGMRALLALGPRAVGYVSCDPATLARDVRTAVEAGWRLRSLRLFDAFPMTQHVEAVAVLEPASEAEPGTR